MKRIKLDSGANKILIDHLRQYGGSAEVNCKRLSISNNLSPTAVRNAMLCLERNGLLTIEHHGHGKPARFTLNEEAINVYENGGTGVRVAERTPRPRAAQKQNPLLHDFRKCFDTVKKHQFGEAAQKALGNLLAVGEKLLNDCLQIEPDLQMLRDGNYKLQEAALGLGASEEEIRKAIEVSMNELVAKMDSDVAGSLPQVAALDFTKLLDEPAEIFKPLANLQNSSKVLRNMFMELEREKTRLRLVHEKLAALIAELQNVEVVDVSAAMKDWKTKGDRLLAGQTARGLAVVSTKE